MPKKKQNNRFNSFKQDVNSSNTTTDNTTKDFGMLEPANPKDTMDNSTDLIENINSSISDGEDNKDNDKDKGPTDTPEIGTEPNEITLKKLDLELKNKDLELTRLKLEQLRGITQSGEHINLENIIISDEFNNAKNNINLCSKPLRRIINRLKVYVYGATTLKGKQIRFKQVWEDLDTLIEFREENINDMKRSTPFYRSVRNIFIVIGVSAVAYLGTLFYYMRDSQRNINQQHTIEMTHRDKENTQLKNKIQQIDIQYKNDILRIQEENKLLKDRDNAGILNKIWRTLWNKTNQDVVNKEPIVKRNVSVVESKDRGKKDDKELNTKGQK